MRTDFCGRITEEYLDQEVTVCGWIHRRRDHGGVIFLDVRDLKGICDSFFNSLYVSCSDRSGEILKKNLFGYTSSCMTLAWLTNTGILPKKHVS